MRSALYDLALSSLIAGGIGSTAWWLGAPPHLVLAAIGVAFPLALGHLAQDANFWIIAAAVMINALAGWAIPQMFPGEPALDYLRPMIAITSAVGIAAAAIRRLVWREPRDKGDQLEA
jgi:hypothetical protein